MIEDKAFKALLELYIQNADNVHMKEPEEKDGYRYLIVRSEYVDEESTDGTFVRMEMSELGSDKFKIKMEASIDSHGCCGNTNIYIANPVIEHASPSDQCQNRMAQMFLKKALLPFTHYVYYAIGIKVCL